MRCAYCHNPDSWLPEKGSRMTTEELIACFMRNRAYYKNGGITATGGEPLLQLEFLTELFRKAKEQGIHTCLDTSGISFPFQKGPQGWQYRDRDMAEQLRAKGRNQLMEDYLDLLAVTDLVLLDIKHTDSAAHKSLTGHANEAVFSFLDLLCERNVQVTVRRVLVPGYTMEPEELMALGRQIGRYPNVKGLEVLPYHTMGVQKYEQLGMKYRLEGVETPSAEAVQQARAEILAGIREVRSTQK